LLLASTGGVHISRISAKDAGKHLKAVLDAAKLVWVALERLVKSNTPCRSLELGACALGAKYAFYFVLL
jgi:hypothetical protein